MAHEGRGNALICICNGLLDFLTTKLKKQSEDDKPTTGVGPELYNKPDFFYRVRKYQVFLFGLEPQIDKKIGLSLS
jgi:YTH domain-containing family protein